MSLFAILSLIVVAAVVVILLLAARKPDTFHVERTQRIKATPERIFPLIDDLQAHERWSPFEQPDPKTIRTCSVPSHGVGAEKRWSGKGKSGAGRFFITASTPPSRVETRLEMTQPMTCDNLVVFTLTPVGDATDVTWAMSGDVPFFAKIFHVFCDMDAMCGREFEKGLITLKQLVE